MDDTPRPTALITGASGGIGAALAKLFAADGSDLVLVARNQERLQSVADELATQHGVTVTVIAADLADPATPRSIYDQLASANVRIDVLVNNAGFGMLGPFAEADTSKALGMIATNVTALTHLTRLFLPGMLERKSGRILNVASTAAFLPGPLMAVYYATKAYVVSFSQAIAEEADGTGVTVTALCPGPTVTGFAAEAGASHATLFKHAMPVERVAAAGYRALQQGKPLEVVGPQNKLVIWVLRFVPRRLAARLARRAQQ